MGPTICRPCSKNYFGIGFVCNLTMLVIGTCRIYRRSSSQIRANHPSTASMQCTMHAQGVQDGLLRACVSTVRSVHLFLWVNNAGDVCWSQVHGTATTQNPCLQHPCCSQYFQCGAVTTLAQARRFTWVAQHGGQASSNNGKEDAGEEDADDNDVSPQDVQRVATLIYRRPVTTPDSTFLNLHLPPLH
mgnify:FL=1